MKLKKLWKRFWWGRRYVGELTIKEWWSWHCPKIPNKIPELGYCPHCGNPLKIHAYLVSSVDGWDFWVDCEDECENNAGGDTHDNPQLVGWWPLKWWAVCRDKDLEKIGIIVH